MKKQPCIMGLYLWPTKNTKKLCCTHSPWPTSPPACPCRPIKGRSSSRRLEYRGAHLLQEYRGAALLLECKGAYLVLEYSSWNTEEPFIKDWQLPGSRKQRPSRPRMKIQSVPCDVSMCQHQHFWSVPPSSVVAIIVIGCLPPQELSLEAARSEAGFPRAKLCSLLRRRGKERKLYSPFSFDFTSLDFGVVK